MTEIQQLTLVIAGVGLLISSKLPEPDVSTWGCARLTFSLITDLVVIAVVVLPCLFILGVLR